MFHLFVSVPVGPYSFTFQRPLA